MEIAKATAQVAEETRQDSAAMKTIAVLTLTFLPGTAVATFFGMDMFNWNPGPGEPVCSAYIWVFFVVTIPVTALVYAAWIWWFKISQKHYQTRHEKGLEDIEKKLKFAARSTTGTW
jgi:Mg2+ and Co2+ transporter CorA